jgi:4a-hydroxytetrahydrobiopterin dehydratase
VSSGSDTRRPSALGWKRVGESLVREFRFRDFSEALAFLERVAVAAEDYLRRPDMCIVEFNVVRLTITNPHHVGITAAELRLAEKVDLVVDG